MSRHLIASLATTDALAGVFDDASMLALLLRVEVALVRVQARLGIVPAKAAEVIATAAAEVTDAAGIARDARESGTLAIPLVRALIARAGARDADAARWVHFGLTSQDVVDTAMVLALQRAREPIARDHDRLRSSLRTLSGAHAQTLMLGRTLLQPALPTTFGYKVAGWYGVADRSGRAMVAAFDGACVVQCGGAVGTLASLGAQAEAVVSALAAELGLNVPDAPWHAHRDRLAALVAACGVYVASLGKIARDIVLLSQDEVGEVAERGGGSSTLPQKRNPAGSAIVLVAADRLPGLVSSFLTSMVQEHERGAGGWHAEWPTLVAAVEATGAAAASAADAIGHLSVDATRMRENVDRTRGVVCAERLMLLLVPSTGRERAAELVGAAVAKARATGVRFGAAAQSMPEIARVIDASTLETIDRPEAYLGAAELWRRALLTPSD